MKTKGAGRQMRSGGFTRSENHARLGQNMAVYAGMESLILINMKDDSLYWHAFKDNPCQCTAISSNGKHSIQIASMSLELISHSFASNPSAIGKFPSIRSQ